MKGVGQKKGIRYYIRQEYKIIDEYKGKYSIKLLCEYMSVSRSGYPKKLVRQKNPTLREITRQSDIRIIKEVHEKHKAYGYRWIKTSIKSYKKEQTDQLITLHTDQGSVYSS